MIKVAFNTNPINSGHKNRGIGIYTRFLLEKLRKSPKVEIVDFKNLYEADLIHYPFFDFYKQTLPLVKKKPTVVTIHDVTPLLFPKHYPPGIKGSLNNLIQRLSLYNVKAILTDSENSKKDIQKVLGIDKDKIFVTYLSGANHYKKETNEKTLESVKKKYKLPGYYALYIGNVNWNKNLLNMAKAAIGADIDFVLIGKSFEERGNLEHPEMRSFKKFLELYEKHPKIHILGFVEDKDIGTIMSLAKVFLFTTFYEGFGMPILEAQRCEVPVITSTTSSLPEVAGESALLVNPSRTEDITDAIKRVIKDSKLARELVQKGLKNIKRFSWEKCAEETIKAYEKALSK